MQVAKTILNYWIEQTNNGYALKGNREISGLTTIAYYDSKKEAELQLKKLTNIKKFDNVEIGAIVSFEENGMIDTGVVDMIDDKIFTLRVVSSWINNNGINVIYNRYLNFYKSGIKTNRFHTNGNAIEIVGKI